MQGMTSRDEVRRDILRMAINRTELRFSDIIEALKGNHSRATVNRYLRELVNDELMMEKPASSQERFKPRYSITKKGGAFLAQNAKGLLIDSAEVLAMLEQGNVGGWPRVLECLRQQGFIGDVEIKVKEGKKE